MTGLTPKQVQKRNNKRKQRRAQKSVVVPAVLKKAITPKNYMRDPRRVLPSDSSVLLSNMQNAIPLTVLFQPLGLQYFCAAYIVKALESGFAGESNNPWDPYFSWVYMTNTLQSAVNSGVPQVQKVPYFFLAAMRAVQRKDVPFKLGSVLYSGNAEVMNPLPQQVIGSGTFGNLFNLLAVTSTTRVNGFPVGTASGWPAYTPDAGVLSFQVLATFMAKKGVGEMARLCENVDISTKTSLDRDVSAFAVVASAQGGGSAGNGNGGFQSLAQLEVPVFHPLLSLLDTDNFTPPFNIARNFNRVARVSGDSMFLGSAMCSQLEEKNWKLKEPVVFKCVDFNAIADTLAQWCTGILNAYINDPANANLTAEQIATLTCPLTLQEVLLLLRNVCMQAFKESQCGVQGLYPYVPANSSDNQFTPYVASATTCFVQAIDMLLPALLVENIRSLSTRTVTMGNGKVTQIWEPVLGQLYTDILASSNYVYSTNTSDPITGNVFAQGAQFVSRKKNAQGIQIETPLDEVSISLIDGNSGSGLVAINDPATLKALSVQWTQWLQTSGLMSYSIALSNMGTEKGISVLASVPMTRYWSLGGSITRKKEERRPSTAGEIVDLRHEKRRYKQVFANNLYSGRYAIADSSYGAIWSVPYEQVQSIWILPYMYCEATGSQSTSPVKMQEMYSEPYLVASTSGTDGIPLSQMHANFAMKMVKAKLSQTDSLMTVIEQCEKSGRGGILSSLISAVGGAIGGPIGSLASTIASVIPI